MNVSASVVTDYVIETALRVMEGEMIQNPVLVMKVGVRVPPPVLYYQRVKGLRQFDVNPLVVYRAIG